MLSGRSSSGLISLDRCLVLTILSISTFMGSSYVLTHYSGTPSSLPVTGFLVILTPGAGCMGFPKSKSLLASGES